MQFPENQGGINHSGRSFRDLGGLILERTGTIELAGASGVVNAFIRRADNGVEMTFPAANADLYAGTVFTPKPRSIGNGVPSPASAAWYGSDAMTIQNVLAIGFRDVFTSNTFSRIRVENLSFDANPGEGRYAFKVEGSYDSSSFLNLHVWPYGTAGTSAITGDNTLGYRRGGALQFIGQNDGTEIDGLFAAYYDNNLYLGGSSTKVGRAWVEHFKTDGGNVGVIVENAYDIQIAQLQIFGQDKPLRINGGRGSSLSISQLHIENPGNGGVRIESGNLFLGTATSRGITQGYVLEVLDPETRLSGRWFDDSPASSDVGYAPAGWTSEKLAGFEFIVTQRGGATSRPDGTYVWVGNVIGNPQITPDAAGFLRLPTTGEFFTVVGGQYMSNIIGGYGGRRITLLFTDTRQAVYHADTVNLKPNSKGDFLPNPGSILELIYDGANSAWREISRTL
ncbi:hypothetical protein [Methylobacterium sp. WL120]|uniref:hypothetical protein n=1 Tax=Methylobacterium sp. WL120 TaxID=2603887 RepID=UPI0016502C9E|nr:hypothetical protein [Methylobacterium sp. WL120]